MFDIELDVAKIGVIDKLNAAISRGEISREEVIDFFTKRLPELLYKPKKVTAEGEDTFPDFVTIEAAEPIYPLEDFPTTPDALNDIISRGVASSTEILNFIRSVLPKDADQGINLPLKRVGPSEMVWTRPLTPEEMDTLMEQHLRRGTFRISSGEEARELL